MHSVEVPRGITTPLLVLVATVVVIATLTIAKPAGAQTPPNPGQGRSHRPVCGPQVAGRARCHSQVVTAADGTTPLATVAPSAGAYAPADLEAAYALSASAGAGQTVAVVAAFDNPNAEADLGAYRSRFGLPACTIAGGCFRKVNQTGASSPLPRADTGWGQEIDLDLQMASAACPYCHLVLVEAASANFSDLGAAVDTAATTFHANAISNSYGGSEFSTETAAAYEGHYNHPGSAITVSSGDNGFGVEFPAASRYVTAVGGTSLTRDGSARGWSEKAWAGAGSGCSAHIPKPAWQTDSGCAMRAVADVAAVADPGTGVATYDSYGSAGGANWYVAGGTSVAAPIIAGVYAAAGNTATVSDASRPYARRGSLNDIVSGTNGTCTVAYLCVAQVGYDGPTGVGTPIGTVAFAATPTSLAAAPLGVTIAGGDAVVNVSWRAAGTGPAVVGYGVFAYDANGYTGKYAWVCASCTTATVTGLSDGVAYRVDVYGFDGVNWGTPASSGWASALAVPAAPTVTAVLPADAGLSVSWRPPTTPGAGIDGYGVFAFDATGYTGKYAWVCATCTTGTVTGLTNGASYYGAVFAHNANGWGTNANSASVVAGTPGPPANVVATRANAAVNATWTAVSPGGAALLGYGAFAFDSSGYTGKYAWVCPTCTTATVPGLNNGTTYTVMVYGYNSFGWGVPTASNAVTAGA